MINITPPSAGDEGESDEDSLEDDERPLSREELKARTLRGLSRKEAKEKKSSKPKSKDKGKRKLKGGVEDM
jgi:hypothetical protein